MKMVVGILVVVAVAGAAGVFLVQHQQESQRRSRILDVLEHGDRLERKLDWSEAIEVYRAALARPLEDAERADVRYRLARSQIEGNDLNGALGILQELTTEDVARFRIDVGPLYFRLAERAREAGNLPLAMIANRQGTAVSPARVEQFMGQREAIAEEIHGQDDPAGTNPPPNEDASEGEKAGDGA